MELWISDNYVQVAQTKRFGLFLLGGQMSDTDTRPQPIASVDEIDEALWWTSHHKERTKHWYRWTDALLDERLRIAKESA
jgi:hypothetical protein